MHDYDIKSYEARERIERRIREAAAERIIRRARIRHYRRRRARLAGALGIARGAAA